MSETQIFVGVDVSKARLDVAVRPSGDTVTVRHDEAGIAGLVTRLQAWQPAAVVPGSDGRSGKRRRQRLGGRRACRCMSSTPAKSGNLPVPPGGWPRRMRSMRRSWPSSGKCCAPRRAHCRMRPLKP